MNRASEQGFIITFLLLMTLKLPQKPPCEGLFRHAPCVLSDTPPLDRRDVPPQRQQPSWDPFLYSQQGQSVMEVTQRLYIRPTRRWCQLGNNFWLSFPPLNRLHIHFCDIFFWALDWSQVRTPSSPTFCLNLFPLPWLPQNGLGQPLVFDFLAKAH